jgi:hypothetical protein
MNAKQKRLMAGAARLRLGRLVDHGSMLARFIETTIACVR